MADTKVTTIRQPLDQAAELEYVARIEGVPISEAIREAISEYIDARRGDLEFQKRLKERIDADQHILQRLAT